MSEAPISEEFYGTMNMVAKLLDQMFNGDGEKKVAFTLLITQFNDATSPVNYISNANRDDVVGMMREILKRFDSTPVETPQ